GERGVDGGSAEPLRGGSAAAHRQAGLCPATGSYPGRGREQWCTRGVRRPAAAVDELHRAERRRLRGRWLFRSAAAAERTRSAVRGRLSQSGGRGGLGLSERGEDLLGLQPGGRLVHPQYSHLKCGTPGISRSPTSGISSTGDKSDALYRRRSSLV